jgi:TRAP-type C4-dicarboxylate transport system substrate-binding protein
MCKKLSLILLAVILAVVFSVPAVMAADEKELSLSLIIPPKHLRYIHVLEPWIKKVAEKSGGKLKITPYFSAALAKPPQTYESIAAGVADIGEGIAYATPGRFPLTEIVMLPELGLESSLSCSTALWKAYKSIPALADEYKDTKLLWLHVTPGTKLITRNKAVRKLDDLKGLKIRVSGAVAAKMGEALGFTPVSMGMGDLYLALEKGVIDGVALPNEILVSRRLGEVTKYVTNIDLGHDAFFITMNQRAWKRLPDEFKKVLDELSGEWAVEFTGKGWDKFDQESIATNKKNGIEYIDLPADEVAKWKELLAPIKASYAKELDAKGLPGSKVLAEMLKMAK